MNWEENGRKELRPNDWVSVTNGRATGRIIGGNLNTIQGIWGSPICLIFKKEIFYLLKIAQKM